MNSKIIYVVTSSASDVLAPHRMCSPMGSEDDVSPSPAAVPSPCVMQLDLSADEVRHSSPFHVTAENPIVACDPKAEQKIFPQVSTIQTSGVRIPMHSSYEKIGGKERPQPGIVLENVDHSAPEVFTIDDCSSELYVPDGAKLAGSKEHRDQNYENDATSACSIVELSIVPEDGLWTCLYCGVTMQSSQDQVRSHINWYCNSKRRSLHSSHLVASRSTSPDIDVKAAVDPSQISTISFVSNPNVYDESCEAQGNCGTGSSVSRSHATFYKCPICNEKVSTLRDHLNNHDQKDLVDVILKFVTPCDADTSNEDEICIVRESYNVAPVAALSVCREMPQASTSQDREQNSLPLSPETKSNCNTFPVKMKTSTEKSQTLKTSQSRSFVPNRGVQSNVLMRRTANPKKSFRQWSSRAPHPCPVCGKVLSSRGNLSKHLLQHSSSKPWNCATCDLGFNSHRDWDYHQLQYHSVDRPHVCPVCSKSFAVLANMKEHVVFHGQKTKACDICGKMFWTSKCVSRHKKRHYTDKKYSCTLCSKKFAIKWDYSLHYKKVHGQE